MNTYFVSLRNIQKAFAVLAIFALVFGPFAKVDFAHAGGNTVMQIGIDTINGQSSPFSFSCPNNPLYNPIIIAGSGVGIKAPGQNQQYHVQINWGDGNTEVVSSTVTPPTGNQDFTFTYSGTHTYTTDGVQNVVISLYHTNSQGQDGPAEATVSVQLCVDTTPGATLTLAKNLVTDNGGTAAATDWTLSAAGTDSISGVTGSTDVSNKTVTPGVYTLSESGPAGYTPSAWSCTAGTLSGSSLTLADGDNATCTITNDDIAPSLTLTKVVSGGTASASDWTVSATGPTSISGAGSASSDSTFSAGTYTLGETLTGTVTGTYSAGDWTCDNATVDGNNQITLALGQTTSCSITNTYVPPTDGMLTIVKHVVNDNGGDKDASNFTLDVSATNPSKTSVTGSEAGETITVKAGDYSVSEANHDGYSVSYSADCTGSIFAGESKTCTVTNDDIAPQLTVTKIVQNDNKAATGTAVASNFTLNVSGINVSNPSFPGDEKGTTVTLDAGAYSVTEGDHAGYSNSTSTDCEGSIAVGEHKYCTVTNNDLDPTQTNVTFYKNVMNDFGGTATSGNFTFHITGGLVDTDVTSGNTLNLPVGTYTITENSLKGYEESDESGICSDDTIVVTADNLGRSYSCTITNHDIQPKLTITKIVEGGDAQVSDFTLNVASTSGTTTVTSGVETGINAGDYTVSESYNKNLGIYTGEFTGDCASDGTVSLSVGDVKSCTLTNSTYTITGYKWYDENGNGVFDENEHTLAGWTITAANGNQSISTTTNALGYYTLHVGEGEWIVTEQQQSGWYQTFPKSNYCDMFLGGESVARQSCNFGNDQSVVPTYKLYGHVWDDRDADSTQGEGEGNLGGWTVTATNGSSTYTTDTDNDGNYSFMLPAGTWTISEHQQSHWNQTFPTQSNDYVHIVVINNEEETYAGSNSFLAAVMNFIAPTAFAQAPNEYGPFNFGNHYRSTPGGSGTVHNGSGSTGSTLPEGRVLGAATSTIPVGAPNTGAGGTSPLVVNLPAVTAILSGRSTARRAKNA